jgi:S-adenosylmethionine:tRNA ribosyltransferase-isomerase
VAAPTAGLHFTDRLLGELSKRGFDQKELTLHVGAGTFVPVKHINAREHAMHAETVIVEPSFLQYWLENPGGLVAVGTTSTRSLETLYWLGVKAIEGLGDDLAFHSFHQWDNEKLPQDIPFSESLGALLDLIHRKGWENLRFSTSLMIVPGYRFRALRGLITNFHMPGSTLLLLIAALIGDDWKEVYRQALEENYRFLSYGDSSLLLP